MPAWARDITVAQVMTADPVTIGPEENLLTAHETMRRHHVRHLPVLLAGKLVGIVAEGDLKRAAPSTLSASEEDYNRVMEQTPIARIMVGQLITTQEQVLLAEAVKALRETKFGSLPVLRDGQLVGILTDNDVLRVLGDLLRQGG